MISSLFSFDYILSRLDFQEIVSAFIVLFAVIDIFGSTPVIISLKNQGRPVSAWKASSISFALMFGFFLAGDAMLKLFSVDIRSFAIAGSLVLFFMSLEMILDITIFKNMGPIKEATLVPVVFPLIAGAGSFTTLLSLKAEYASTNIAIAGAQLSHGLHCDSRHRLGGTPHKSCRNLSHAKVFRHNPYGYFRKALHGEYHTFNYKIELITAK